MTARPGLPWRWILVTGLVGMAVMTAELVTPRRVAPTLGSGTLTWAWTLATWLLGLALGNAWGGRRADGGSRWLPALLAVAGGIAVALALPLTAVLREATLELPWTLRTPVLVLPAYLPAAFLLGALGTVAAQRAVAGRARAGPVLGALSAAGAVGSVAGTALTGFLWIPHHPVSSIHLGTAIVLGAVALLAGPGRARVRAGDAPSPKTASPDRKVVGRGPWGLLALLTGGTLLGVEILASRMATLHLGSSLYTWTSVIGTMLLALAVGNAWGGPAAERAARDGRSRAHLGRWLLIASATTATLLWTPALLSPIAGLSLPWALRVALGCLVAFAAPAVALGVLSPALVRCALDDAAQDGARLGRMHALATVGAVTGSVLVPLVLIPWTSLPLMVLLLAIVLGIASDRVVGRRDLPWLVTLGLLVLVAWAPLDIARRIGASLGLREDGGRVWVADSRHFHVRVEPWPEHHLDVPGGMDAQGLAADERLEGRARYDATRGRLFWRGPLEETHFHALRDHLRVSSDDVRLAALRLRAGAPLWQLSIDRLVHGFVDRRNPLWMEYDYERVTAALVDAWLNPRPSAQRVLLLGGGAYTYQRYLLGTRGPDLSLRSLEIDPVVTRAAREALGLQEDARHTIVHEDARAWVLRDGTPTAADADDLVIGDVFHDVAVPWHLTTREFVQSIHDRLAARRGLYVLNVVDDPREGRFLGAVNRTLSTAFDHVDAFITRGTSEPGRDTVLFVAGFAPLEEPVLAAARSAGARRADAAAFRRWDAASGGLLLTDDHAPVEWLLAPVIEARGAGASTGAKR